jgi:hypothetical protein
VEFAPVRARTSFATGCNASWIPSACMTARRGASSNAIGAPNSAIAPSPVNWFTVPS